MAVSIHNFDEEYVKELATIELAYHIFREVKVSFHFNQLAEEIKKIKKINNESLHDILPQLYTELNLDGRFLHLGKNEWGLKSWYSLETAEELLKIREADDDVEDDDFVELIDEEIIAPTKSKKNKSYDLADDTDTDEFDTDEEEIADEEEMDDDLDEDIDADIDDFTDEDLDYEDVDEDKAADGEIYYIDEELDKE